MREPVLPEPRRTSGSRTFMVKKILREKSGRRDFCAEFDAPPVVYWK
mgnify:FL=1|jgi:hypothetical protein